MRIQTSGVGRRGPAFHFKFEEQMVLGYAGETLASALISAGIYGFRETRSGQPRGVFCGMGVCGDCQVLVDGESRRACMEPARADISVARHPALLRPRAPHPGRDVGAWIERTPDVLVIGAGPAGLSAAITAAKAGLEVLVVDERKNAGGQYFKQPGVGFEVDEGGLDPQFSEGRRLISDAQDTGVQFCLGAVVWGIFNNRAAILTPDECLIVCPKRWVLSPGAYERALPVPGWTLPGVMTTGAAQTLLRAYQTAPGKRVLIAGNGPLNLQVADELCRAGVQVVAVAELARPLWRAGVGAALAMTWLSPGLALAGVRHLMHLARRRVPVFFEHVLQSVDGEDKAARVCIAALDARGTLVAGSQKRFDIDAVCVNYGFLPQTELARALDCAFDYDHASGQLRAQRAEDGRTSVNGVFIVGDAGGLGGAKVALDQGELAGLSVVRDLQPSRGGAAASANGIRRRLRRNVRFQNALWQLFAAPYLTTELVQPDTLVCRCEEIAHGTLKQLLTEYHPGLAATKKATRAGMGRCQGRYCTTLIAAMAQQAGGAPPAAADFFAPRPPAKPVPIGRIGRPIGNALPSIDVNNSTSGRDPINLP